MCDSLPQVGLGGVGKKATHNVADHSKLAFAYLNFNNNHSTIWLFNIAMENHHF